MGRELRGVAPHFDRFLLAPTRQWICEIRIGDPMPAAYERRQKAAIDLVLALRAGLEPDQAFAQAVIDALVVASLERPGRVRTAPQ